MGKAREIQLRPVTRADLPLMQACEADGVACAMAGVIGRGLEAYLAHWEKVLADAQIIPRVIEADGVFAGSISCFPRDGKNYFGYWLAREQWGRGISSRAVAMFLEAVPARPLWAQVQAGNVASLRVLAKNGFVEVERKMEGASERYMAGEVVTFRLA